MQLLIAFSATLLYAIHAGPRWWSNVRGKKRNVNPNAHLAALIAALDDYRKTQLFFVMVIQVACLIASQDGRLFQASSIAQKRNNTIFLYYLMAGGISSIVLLQVLLWSADKFSLLLDLLSTVTLWVAVPTIVHTSGSRLPLDNLITMGPVLDVCGGATSTRYCKEAKQISTGIEFEFFFFILIALLGLYQMILFVLHSCTRGMDEVDKRHMRTFTWPFFHAPILLACLAGSAVALLGYVRILQSNSGAFLDRTKWSLGQILAVTIWILVMVEYFNYVLCTCCTGSLP